MKRAKIYFSAHTELTEYEAINKGYRIDVYVIIGEYVFNPKVYSMARLQQDFEAECEEYGYYSIEPNLVLVRGTSTEEIVYIINKLHSQNYFEGIKPIKEACISGYSRIQ